MNAKKQSKENEKKPKEKDNKFWGINIKLRSNIQSGESFYEHLITRLFAQDVVGNIGMERAMILRSQFTTTIEFNQRNHTIYYGKITRFTKLESKNWLHLRNKDFTNPTMPLDQFPNPFETDYIFIPAAHRLLIKKDPKISIKSVETYLKEAIPNVIEKSEDFSVHIIQSSDVIDKIISSNHLKHLEVTVSYTNDDLGDEAQKLIDDLLRKAGVNEQKSVLKPVNKGELNGNSPYIRGLLEIAKENGSAEATVKNESGGIEKIRTKEHPEEIIVKSTEDDIIKKASGLIMNKYRDDINEQHQ